MGSHVRELRKAKGMTQRELGARTDIEEQNIHRIESGDTNPTAYTIYRLAVGLNVEMEELMKFKVQTKK